MAPRCCFLPRWRHGGASVAARSPLHMPLDVARSRFLTAEWLDLAMLSYQIDPAILAARVPAGCELDSFAGRTYVSVVGFRFLRTRVLGLPIPFHVNFDE